MLSKFNGTPTPKGSHRAKTGDNDCSINSSLYSLSTALCESIRYQAKSEQNVRQDLIPRGATGRLLSAPLSLIGQISISDWERMMSHGKLDFFFLDVAEPTKCYTSHKQIHCIDRRDHRLMVVISQLILLFVLQKCKIPRTIHKRYSVTETIVTWTLS